MEERRDYIALDWVSNEIQETLQQALQALDAYVQNPEDVTKLRFGLSYVHQVLGSLRMVEFPGAALLAEELEYTLQALLQQKIPPQNSEDALLAIQNGMRQLPLYLQRAKHSRSELPATLLPMINDLRAVRGQIFASQSQVFSPQLPPVDGQRISLEVAELNEMAGKLRQMFQIALLGFLRGNDTLKNLNYLAKVFARMVKLCEGREQQGVWKASIALTEGLLNQTIASSPAVRSLLRQIDALIRRFVEQGDAALDLPAPDGLLRNMLFYIAASKAPSRFIGEIRLQCQLDHALPGTTNLADEHISEPDVKVLNEIIERASNALRELAAQQASRAGDAQGLRELLPAYRNILDTLAVIGMSVPLRNLQQEYVQLSRQLSNNELNAELLSNGAEKLVQLAESFGTVTEKPAPALFNDSEEAQGHLDSAHAAVIREARNGLEQAKEAVIEFVARQWQHDCLENIPALLKEIAGSLLLADMPRAAAVVNACENFVRNNLLSSKDVPEWQLLDTLADAIASIDYYLELTGEDNEFDTSHVLNVAEESAARLGYPLDAQLIDTKIVTEKTYLAEEAQSSVREIPDNVVLFTLPEFTSAVIQQPESSMDFSTAEIPEAEAVDESPVLAEKNEEVEKVIEAAVKAEALDEEYDPEIVEIFIEEAGEVIDTINEYFPRWLLDPYDSETMPTIRRAFHTLKGSGRMVGANDIGEMAWSIENMLNRVIDGTVKMDQQRLDLVTEAKDLAPVMVAAFSERRRCDMVPVNALMEKAFALAKEQNPQWQSAETLVENTQEIEIPETDLMLDTPAEQFDNTDAENLPGYDFIEQTVNVNNEVETAETIAQENEYINDDERELLEIFSAEAAAHLDVLKNFIADVQHHALLDISEDLQRALHTLKGSANMAGITPVAKIVTPVEKMVKELRAAQLQIDEPVLALLVRAAEFIQSGIDQLFTRPHAELAGAESFIAEVESLHQQRLDDLQSAFDSGADSEGIPPEVLSRFLMDVMDQLVAIGDDIALWRDQRLSAERIQILPATTAQVVSLAAGINITPIEQLAQTFAQFLQRAADTTARPAFEFFALASVTIDTLIDMLDRIAGQQEPQSNYSLMQQMDDFVFATTESIVDNTSAAEQFIEQFVALDNVQIEENFHTVDDVARGGEVLAEFADIVADQFEHEAPSADIEAQTYVDDAELQATDFDADLVETAAEENTWFTSSQEEIVGQVEENLEAIDYPQNTEENLAAINDEIIAAEFDDEPVLLEEQTGSVGEIPVDAIADIVVENNSPESLVVAHEATIVEDEETAEEVDPDILEIFLEEAADLLDGLDETISGWNDDPDSSSAQEEMQRLLHTLKGGARLSGLRQLGNLTHNFETFLINAQQQNLPVDSAFLAQVQSYQDQLVQRVEAVRRGEKETPLIATTVSTTTPVPTASEQGPVEMTAEEAADDLAAAAEELQRMSEAAKNTDSNISPEIRTPENIIEPASAKTDNILPFSRSRNSSNDQRQEVVPFTARRATPSTTPVAAPRRPEHSSTNTAALDDPLTPQHLRKAPQEAIKISAQLLEQLVNLAGETSISRGRVEAQVSEVLFSLEDMQATVNRLQDQLRRLDLETEAQILFRQEQLETEGAEDFDPLEFDRYSVLQQLARSLMESASDLTDIRGTLVDKSKDMETLLVQQSRINTELQEGLMRSRMVPFSRMVPRLRRIVRQVATELDKDVEMYVDNAEGELDRTMLERINAPLEHMLRNAVDHGIESADVRARVGKPAQGTVRLSLLREGADVVLVLEDDGGGIDVEAVRAKAIERGLLSADAHISDHETLQFIMQPGFSTAKQITQISGRGVGMDVVASEIKQLGGNLDIQSVKGKGTRFVVRLPFTVSINRALMVTVAGDSYAIPLNTIEGIVRVSPFELEAYYQPDAPPFEYAGQPYTVRYLGSLLHSQEHPNLEGLSLPLPVILVRAGEYAVAVQVDSLQGSREVVVKSLGAQFAMVQGLSGATVLGDGSVVVILDLMAMLRAEILQASRALLDGADQKARVDVDRPLLVMVVDDSVTVRKVTTRFLERQGMEVITAKDGADAMAHLLETDRIPDVMLLDIEMPRMDGFEVASRVRHNSRLKDIPIIMITSRTGDKHRERAMSLGVNRYLGKPYQENVVLDNIAELTGREN